MALQRQGLRPPACYEHPHQLPLLPQDGGKSGTASTASQQQILVLEIQDRFGVLFLDYK